MTFDGEREIWPIFAVVFVFLLALALIVCYRTCRSRRMKTDNMSWFFLSLRQSGFTVHNNYPSSAQTDSRSTPDNNTFNTSTQPSSRSTPNNSIYTVSTQQTDLQATWPTLPPSYDDVIKDCALSNHVLTRYGVTGDLINDPPPPYTGGGVV